MALKTEQRIRLFMSQVYQTRFMLLPEQPYFWEILETFLQNTT